MNPKGYPEWIALAHVQAALSGRKLGYRSTSRIQCRKIGNVMHVCVTREDPVGRYMKGPTTWFVPIMELIP
jgi:hypothetical protein